MLVVVGAGATDEHRGGLALEAALHVLDHGTEGGHLLGDDFLGAVDELFVAEEFCDLAQRLGRLLGADEVHLDPRDAELRLHHLGHVIDRAVAHDDVEVGGVALADLLVADVARERRGDVDAALLEELVDLPGVATDIVFAEDVDAELRLVGLVEQTDHVLKHAVVGDMVAGGLGDALVAFAGEAEDVDPKFLLGFAADGVDVVADQADRAGGVHGDGLGLEDPVGLADGGGQFLLTAEDDLLLHHVGRHGVLEIVDRLTWLHPGEIAARGPRVVGAADGTVGDVEDVVDGADDDAAAAGVGASTLGDDTGDGAGVGGDLRRRAGIVGEKLFLTLLFSLRRIDRQHLGAHRGSIGQRGCGNREAFAVVALFGLFGKFGHDDDFLDYWLDDMQGGRADCRAILNRRPGVAPCPTLCLRDRRAPLSCRAGRTPSGGSRVLGSKAAWG